MSTKKKRRGAPAVKVRRVNINLSEEENEVYLTMKQYALEDRKTLHDFILDLFKAEEQRRKARRK